MRIEPTPTFGALESTSSTYRVLRRPSATFLVLERVADGPGPGPGTFGCEIEIEIAGVRAPCGLTVLEEGLAGEVWCRPRGPLPLIGVGDEAILRFASQQATDRR